jgi:hypothetical protein
MIRSRLTRLALAASIAMAGSAFAQPTPTPAPVSVAGDWDVTVQSPQGTNTVLVTLKQDGEKLEGLFKSPLGELPFSGTLTGNEMKFNFMFPVDGQPLAITMTGKVEGENITGKADFGGFAEGDWSAKRAKPAEAAAATTAPATTTDTTASTSTTTASSATTTASSATTTAGVGYAGKWDVVVKTPAGDFPATANLVDDAGKLSGTFASQMGEVPVTGVVDGKSVKLTMNAQTPNGAMTVVLTGDLDGDSIVNGKADIEGMGQMDWTAKRIKP